MGLKGIAYTIDVLIALGLAAMLFFFLRPTNIENREISFEYLSYQSEDLINLLTNLKVISFSQTPTISELISRKILDEKDLNRTVLDLIGSFWYSGNKSIASNITKDILQNLTNNCFSLQVQNETIYSSCNYTSNTIAVAYRMASGYEIGKPVFGYIARAWATKVLKNTTQIIPFYPEGSGWRPSKSLTVKKNFYLSNITIYEAKLYVSLHFGCDKNDVESGAGIVKFLVNGKQRKNDINWLYLQQSIGFGEITTAAYGFLDVTEDLIPNSQNTIEFEIKTPFYHSHIHPGMRLILTHSISQEMFTANTSFNKRFYFDSVKGETGAWSMISFYIPENAKNISAFLNLNAKNVDDTKYFMLNATDIKVYVNSDVPIYKDGVTENCYYYTDSYYCKRTIVGEMNPRLYLNITDNLINGTNVVSIYLNCYGDNHWGDEEAIIYSDPVNDPNNSSYVEVSYILEKPQIKYGEIDITKEKLFGGNESNPKNFKFNLSASESNLIETFTHIAQGFSSMIKAYAWFNGFTKNLIFVSPSVRTVPESVYIDPSIWSVGENNIELVDVQPGGSVSDTNYILPWSSFEYTYIVKGLVGYGNVFNSSQLAIEDAKQRLVNQIGAEGIQAESIKTDSQSVQGIQWLWGPAIFKILSWERK
ncbi:MAG: hypothetical protein QXX38_01815 [Candidatus Aenigmatarchaeota archaeon]